MQTFGAKKLLVFPLDVVPWYPPVATWHPTLSSVQVLRDSFGQALWLGHTATKGTVETLGKEFLGCGFSYCPQGGAGNFGPNRHQGWKGKVLRNFWQAVGKIPPESLGIIEFSLEFSASRKLESPEWPYEVVLGKAEHPLGGPEGSTPRGNLGKGILLPKSCILPRQLLGCHLWTVKTWCSYR